jgi:CubicO group peptidase (beta-lactamase class C family)
LQLLQNTGCVGNYSDVPGNENNDQTQYVSSRVTLSSKQSGVLQSNNAIFTPCSPGNTYRYSTHGYTLAAAALESRSGMNFDALLRARISNPLGLRTLRTETRSNGASKGDLAQLYARPSGGGYTPLLDNNFQNISWKWGGGGMEVSALDLAKFGNAMLDNKLFPQSLRDQMWSGSSARNSYGAGWDTNSTTNPTLVQKQGRQQSSLSHIRIDVDDDIVVVAMTNGSYRSSEGSIITQLTADLMTIARTNQ